MPTVKITDATVEPVTLAEAKLWMKVDGTEEDALISSMITGIRRRAEHLTQRTMLLTTWELVCDSFPSALRLLYPTILGVTSLKYLDVNGVQQTLDPADYVVDGESQPGYVVPAYGKAWPSTYGQVNAVRVRYTAGYGTTADKVPEQIKIWIRLHLEHVNRNRGAMVSTNVQTLPFLDNLLDSERVWLM